MQTKTLTVLSHKESKNIEKIIKKNYGVDFDLGEFLVMIGPEERVWFGSKDIWNFDMKELDINSVGMNFGKIKSNNKIFLTIEGSQIIGREATRNVLELNEEDAKKFMAGNNIQIASDNCDLYNFVIIKSGKNILGSGLLTEEGIKNLLPISRRIQQF